jgi:hypothetical protein
MNAKARATAYVKKGPPFYFESDYKDAKLLGNKDGGCGCTFDRQTKQWFAKNGAVWQAAWATGAVRLPDLRVDASLVLEIFKEQDAEVAKRIAEASAKAAMSQEEVDERARKALCVPANSEEHVRELAELGISLSVVAASAKWPRLGPRAGISDAHRVLRGIKLGKCSPQDVLSGALADDSRPHKRLQKRPREARDGQGKREASATARAASAATESAEEAAARFVGIVYRQTQDAPFICERCCAPVSVQFEECKCREWRRCVETGGWEPKA